MRSERTKKLLKGLFFAAVLVLMALCGWMAFRAYFVLSEQNLLWEETKQELWAKGESLSVDDFISPEIPDERNFFADPLWEDLSNRAERELGGIRFMEIQVPEKERRTYALSRPFGAAEREELEGVFPEFSPWDASKNAGRVLADVWKREEGGDPASRRRAAHFVELGSKIVEPVLSRIDELAKRPEARFSIFYHDGFAMDLAHIVPLLEAANWLRLRGLAAIELGEPGKAAEEALRILRLAAVQQNEPIFISVLGCASMNLKGLELINAGIGRQIWEEEDLREFVSALAEIDLIPALARSLRSERAMACESIEKILLSASNEFLESALGGEGNGSYSIRYSPRWYWVYRHFFFPEDKAFFSRSIQSWVEALDAADDEGLQARRFPQSSAEARRVALQADGLLFSALMLPVLESGVLRVLWMQNQTNLTRMASALELFRLKYGEYPKTLKELVPQYFEILPPDLTTLQAPRYEKTAADSFRLWSLGWNGSDEGGVADKKREAGDWVWDR